MPDSPAGEGPRFAPLGDDSARPAQAAGVQAAGSQAAEHDVSPPSPEADPTAPASSEEKPASKAGRNLPAAIGVGVLLAALVVVSLVWQQWLFLVLAIAVCFVGVNELIRAFNLNGVVISRTPLYVGVAAVPAAAYIWGTRGLVAAFGAVVVATLVWRIRKGTQDYVRDTTASVFVAAYVPLMLGFAAMLLAETQGAWRIVAFVLLTIGNDIGGYASGVLFGKHPIAPQVSPKKSWEGLAGSVLVQVVLGVGLFVLVFDAPWWQGAITGAVMAITATAGDFVESAIKRDLGVKDLGSILPGHGGVMDRLDSLVINAFVAWALFTIFLGP